MSDADDRAGGQDDAGAGGARDDPSPPDAFQALADDVRTGILRDLAPEGRPIARTFTELFEAADVETSAGFAYHLRQLDGRFVRETDDGYELTYAGLSVVRGIRAGEFTERVDRPPFGLAESCPLCAQGSLELGVEDNVVAVRCGDCERIVLSVPQPPAGVLERDDDEVPWAVDRYQRARIALAADGVCPECGGPVDAGLERPPERLTDGTTGRRAIADLQCEACTLALRVPVTLCVLDHPAIVSACHDHGVDVRQRPLWNVGEEFRETVIATDPWCVRVRLDLEGTRVDLYVDGEASVRATDTVDRDGGGRDRQSSSGDDDPQPSSDDREKRTATREPGTSAGLEDSATTPSAEEQGVSSSP